MIAMRQAPDEASRTPENSCRFVADCEIDGAAYRAASRRGAPFALARTLVAAGVPDQPVEVTHAGLRGAMRYRSLHRMAGLTIEESATRPVRLGRWRERPDLWNGEPQNGGRSPAEVPEYPETARGASSGDLAA